MGRLVLFLHAHLPFVRHLHEAGRLEEDWLFEAITGVYLPLCQNLEAWRRDGVSARIAMSLTPPLSHMLKDPLLLERYVERTKRLRQLADDEVRRARDTARWPLARMYRDHLDEALDDFEHRYDRDLVRAFAEFQQAGLLEIAASAATHAYLPLLGVDQSYARAQIRIGVRHHRELFGVDPSGFWLPECGYEPGLDKLLADEGIRYFIIDTHGVTNADPPPAFGHYAPLITPSGVLAFARDPASSERVWSAETGFPGDQRYRERYRDAGYDLTDQQLGDLVLADGRRRAVGLKYHRITGRDVPLADKAPYDRVAAMDAIETHASTFVEERRADAQTFFTTHDRPAAIVAPYDAELFGHWWFEGPAFVNRVVRKVADDDILTLATPTDIIDSDDRFQLASPARSSWGRGGHAQTWLSPETEWLWPRLHDAAERMTALASARRGSSGLERRALAQLGRELLLASASDWPFIITNRTVVGYAERRVRAHLDRFDTLHSAISTNTIDLRAVEDLEREDNVLTRLDPADFVRG